MQIFSLWDGGANGAPDVVKHCFDRWQTLNPGYNLTVFDGAGLRETLQDYPSWIHQVPIQALSDIFRLELLARNGGVWVDATAFPVIPLDDWLPAALEPAGFFAFTGRRGNRWSPLDSWFLAAQPGNAVCRPWREAIRAYWDRPRQISPASLPHRRRPGRLKRIMQALTNPKLTQWEKAFNRNPRWSVQAPGREAPLYPYFWVFLLAAELYHGDPDFRAALEAMPAFPHELTHVLAGSVPSQASTYSNVEGILPVLLSAAPVHKLDWRRSWPETLWRTAPSKDILLPVKHDGRSARIK